MAPIKFEDKIKEKLEQRTIEPSAESWSKMSKRLDEDVPSKNPRLFWFIGIAAGIILMLAITIQFFGGNTSEEVIPQVVEEQKAKGKIDGINSNSSIDGQEEKLVEASAASKLSKEKVNNEINKTARASKQNSTKLIDKIRVASVEKTSKEKRNDLEEEIKENKGRIKEESIIKESVVAQVLKDLNNTAPDKDIEREVDSLLKLASKELFKNKLKEESSKIVDAKALLESVQEDMGQSFRTRVFEALKDSYVTVKTAVAERNN